MTTTENALLRGDDRGAAAGSPPPRAALLGAIQGGARLRKTSTNDRSSAAGAGNVVGSVDNDSDVSANAKDNDAIAPDPGSDGTASYEAAPSDQDVTQALASAFDKRQSVDWYGGLAAESVSKSTGNDSINRLTVVDEAAEGSDGVEPVGESSESLTFDADDPSRDFDISICKCYWNSRCNVTYSCEVLILLCGSQKNAIYICI